MSDEHRLLEFITKKILRDRPDVTLGPDDDLLASGLVESLDVMRIVAFVENDLGVRVPPEDVRIENFIDVRSMVAYVESRRSTGQNGH